MRSLSALEKQGAVGRESEGDCRSSPAAHVRFLR